MPANFSISAAELIRVLPEIVLSLMGILIMAVEVSARRGGRRIVGYLALAGLLAAGAATWIAHMDPGFAFRDMVVVDGFATFFRVLVLVVGLLTVLASLHYLRGENAESGEYYALLLFCIAGQSFMASANELIMIFIGLEISSIASYVLAGYLRRDLRNTESAIKYFLLGSFATAFLLYGVAWIYGFTGSTDLQAIRATLVDPDLAPPVLVVGLSAALLFVGFAFKVSAAPFQAWAPDVYQGAPAPVAAFLSAGPKAAAFAVLLRVFMTAFEPYGDLWEPVVWAAALLSMVVGNFAALTQTNLKRLLAYSSIAHAGYVLVAVTARSETGTAAAMFYLAAYAFMNVGAFAVVVHFARQGERYVNIEDLAGFAHRQPATAGLFTLFLLSLIGVPLTGGFFGKFYVFKAALDSDLLWLTVLGLLNSAVAAYYYLRIIVLMYFHEPAGPADTAPQPGAPLRLALWGSALATLVLGILPSWVLNFAGRAAVLAP